MIPPPSIPAFRILILLYYVIAKKVTKYGVICDILISYNIRAEIFIKFIIILIILKDICLTALKGVIFQSQTENLGCMY